MSRRYLGGFITANPTIPTASSASGAWTLNQQFQYANTWPFGGPFTYVEDVFSTYLYTGNGSTQTITNGIDLAGKGGLTWIKRRDGAVNHYLATTVGGTSNYLNSNTTSDYETGVTTRITSFNADGFSLGSAGSVNNSGSTFASWTFREQAKFFDVVTGTGGGTFNHSLGVTPGMIMIKLTSGTSDWWTVHRSSNGYFRLNLTNAAASTGTPGIASSGAWVNANSTTFSTSNFVSSGESFVAYLFAHDAGGFGLTGTDNVISCGTFTGNTTVNLGYEPQWILLKNTGSAENWYIHDNMRGWPVSGDAQVLYPNLSSAESSTSQIYPNATGFSTLIGGGTYIYMAIRRGPMAVPTLGTSVFQPVRYAGATNTFQTISTGKTFATDWLMTWDTDNGAFGSTSSFSCPGITRLTGFGVNPPYLRSTNGTNAESPTVVTITLNNSNNNYTVGGFSGNLNSTGSNYTHWNFGRAPGFFDVVCYTGDGVTTGRQVTHNLGVAPEFIIVKSRSNATNWTCYVAPLTASGRLTLNSNLAVNTTTPELFWGNGTTTVNPTSTVFTLGSDATALNQAGSTYVAYLFATLAGVSKVGSYTGTGATQTINCGFTGGARWVMIKRTDSTGNWWVWDTATGMVAGNDTRIAINDTAQIINQNWVYTITTGFQIVTTNAEVNASGGSYIFLAIA